MKGLPSGNNYTTTNPAKFPNKITRPMNLAYSDLSEDMLSRHERDRKSHLKNHANPLRSVDSVSHQSSPSKNSPDQRRSSPRNHGGPLSPPVIDYSNNPKRSSPNRNSPPKPRPSHGPQRNRNPNPVSTDSFHNSSGRIIGGDPHRGEQCTVINDPNSDIKIELHHHHVHHHSPEAGYDHKLNSPGAKGDFGGGHGQPSEDDYFSFNNEDETDASRKRPSHAKPRSRQQPP